MYCDKTTLEARLFCERIRNSSFPAFRVSSAAVIDSGCQVGEVEWEYGLEVAVDSRSRATARLVSLDGTGLS